MWGVSMRENNRAPVTVRILDQSERDAALSLAWKVFCEFESPDYAPEGTAEFKKCLDDESYLAGIRYYGAFDGERLVGLLGIREDRCHICFFFVDGPYHRRGIGTRLFERMREDHPNRTITLNSSPYGLPFYRRLGFRAAAEEQTVNGIRFTPMAYGEKPRLETARLVIDPLRPEDREDYFTNISHDKNVLETFVCRYAESLEDFDFSSYLKNETLFAIRLKETERLVGNILYFDAADGSCEIGYGLGSGFWGRGFATEAVGAFLSYLLCEKGFARVYASFFRERGLAARDGKVRHALRPCLGKGTHIPRRRAGPHLLRHKQGRYLKKARKKDRRNSVGLFPYAAYRIGLLLALRTSSCASIKAFISA